MDMPDFPADDCPGLTAADLGVRLIDSREPHARRNTRVELPCRHL